MQLDCARSGIPASDVKACWIAHPTSFRPTVHIGIIENAPAGPPADAGAHYCEYAHVPRLPWQVPRRRRMSIQDLPVIPEIAVMPVPNGIIELFWTEQRRSVSGGTSDLSFRVGQEVRSQLANELAALCGATEGFRPLGFKFDAPGLLTVTVDEAGRRIGLHVDSWFGAGCTERDHRPNRISVNLGPGTRHLLVVPQSRALWQAAPDKEAAEAVFDFFSTDSVRTCLAVAVPPGHAYVASTEAYVHDASTVGDDRGTLTFTLVGDLAPWSVNPSDWSASEMIENVPGDESHG